METKTTNYKRCDVVKVTGRVDSATAPQLSSVLEALADAGRHRVVLDMTNLEFISSAGLRVLVNMQKTNKRNNRGEVVLACVPKNIYNALDLAGFTILFKFFDDLLTAVGSF
jgi:anti-sigma B factor antagonist